MFISVENSYKVEAAVSLNLPAYSQGKENTSLNLSTHFFTNTNKPNTFLFFSSLISIHLSTLFRQLLWMII